MGARWLSAREQAVWRRYLLVTQTLDEALDRQLQRDAGMPHAYYAILVVLSEAPGQSMRMRDVAAALSYSPSRLTHAVAAMERQGWVRRQPTADDKRGQLAVLTKAGRKALEAAAPGHVAEVRRLVFDRLTPEQLAQLDTVCKALLEAND